MSGLLSLSRREWMVLGGIMLAALALRVVWLQFEFAITPDGFYYATLGESLVSGDLGGGLSLYWPPFYPLLVGISSRIFGDLELGGRMVSAVLGSLLLLPSYLLFRAVRDRSVAWVGVSLLAFQPDLLRGSTLLLSDVPFTFLFVTAILLGMVALSEGRRGLLLATGLFLAAAYLTRPEAFGYFLLFLSVAAVAVFRMRGFGGGRRWTALLALVGGFAVLTVPYMLYLRAETGRWTISAKLEAHFLSGGFSWRDMMTGNDLTYADSFYADARPEPAAAGAPPAAGGGGGRFPLKRIAWMVNETWREYTQVIPVVFPPLVLLLAGIGVFAGGRTRERTARELYLLGFVAATFVGYGVTFSYPRYLMPVVPLVYLWVSGGLVEVGRRLRRLAATAPGVLSRVPETAILATLVLGLGLTMFKEVSYQARRGKWEQAYEMKLVGRWIGERSVDQPVLMANSPVVAFYAGVQRCFYLPNLPAEELVAHAERRGVDYVVVDERKIRERGLEMQVDLLERPEEMPGLRLVYSLEEAPGARVRVFELAPDSESGAGS